MLFRRCMGRRHLSKLLLHPLKDKARPRQPRDIVIGSYLPKSSRPSDAVLLVLNILSG
jgi:hypothetical protein